MANNAMIVEERSRDIGRFLVGRLLPFSQKRQVGPFTFIDHMGPSEIGPEFYMDVDQHPHVGLSTLTFLIEGEMMHRDSTGAVQRITPGSVNWMIAGKGVTHTERTPDDLRNGKKHAVHGYQVWVALPKEQELDDPSFHHVDASELPQWFEHGVQCRLVAGSAFGRHAPNPVKAELFMVEMKSEDIAEIDTRDQLKGEIAIVVVKGTVISGDETLRAGQMLISKTTDTCGFTMGYDSHVLLFGGIPYSEERHMHWNFVASTTALLQQAIERWRNREFPKVPGDDTYIPLP